MSLVKPLEQPEPTEEYLASEDAKLDAKLVELVDIFCKAVYYGDYFNQFNVWYALVDGSLNSVINEVVSKTSLWDKLTKDVEWVQTKVDGVKTDNYEETLLVALKAAGGWVYTPDFPSVPMRGDAMATYHWNVLEEKYLAGKPNAVRIKKDFGAVFK